MAIPKRSAIPGTYFVTSVTWNRRRIFQVPAHAEVLIETLQHYRRLGRYKLHAYVVMPDHIHVLLTPQGIALERAMGLIKGGFSHRLALKSPIWQRGFADRRMRNREEYESRLHYLQQNPVRGGFVEHAEDYPFSSAFRQTESPTARGGLL